MPRHAHATPSIVTTRHSRSQNGVLRTPMPVVHAEFEQANARWKALCKRSFGMARTNGKERTKNLRARLRLDRQAPSIGVPPRLWLRRPNATTQLQFRA